MVERHRVVLFLDLVKRTARERFVFVGRRENLDALALLGITRKHAESLVTGLKPEHYVSGPEPDRNDPGLDMWTFGLQVAGHEVYVKLQVAIEPARCVCVSFHESVYPMHYPFREAPSPENQEGPR